MLDELNKKSFKFCSFNCMLLSKVLDVHTTVQLHRPLCWDIVPGHHVLFQSSGVACPVKHTTNFNQFTS
jgi:hypothetical protein